MKFIKDLLPSPIALAIGGIYFFLSLILSFDKLGSLWYQIPLLIIGLVFGLMLVKVDRLYLHHLYRSNETDGLVTQSLLFLGLFVPLSFFVVTSTGSILGGGLIVGFLAEITATFFGLRSDKALLEKTYFYQLQRSLTGTEIQLLSALVLFWNVSIWLLALI